jgi:hypothetical protein
MFVARPEMNVLFIKKGVLNIYVQKYLYPPLGCCIQYFTDNFKSLLSHIGSTLVDIILNIIVDLYARPLCIDVFGSSIDVTSLLSFISVVDYKSSPEV